MVNLGVAFGGRQVKACPGATGSGVKLSHNHTRGTSATFAKKAAGEQAAAAHLVPGDAEGRVPGLQPLVGAPRHLLHVRQPLPTCAPENGRWVNGRW